MGGSPPPGPAGGADEVRARPGGEGLGPGARAAHGLHHPLPPGDRLRDRSPLRLDRAALDLGERRRAGPLRAGVRVRGPYRLVRHPGYAGNLLALVGIPLTLDSGWAFVGSAIALAVALLRTALEDRTLQAELPGYRAYADRVRYRLIPGLW
ncbi:MAG: isoprenylcysteine carboxylmethyltransferase family protein [Myxococcales bacterium]|nr:isoprenylcysteine carboxylmethyltransferase family protein [Myxococcales bacterium]